MHIYCDFDGTVSVLDATDFVLSRLADPQWLDIEQLWQDGQIGSGECMRRQISMLEASPEHLDAVLDGIAIDPFFPPFIEFCAARRIPVTIVSDGVDHFIRRILRRHGLAHLPVVANKLIVGVQGARSTYSLLSPHADKDCQATAGVCKCRTLKASGPRIYIGDGRSDFCVSDKPDLVFAKGALAEYCANRAIPFRAYQDFGDLTASLEAAMPYFRNATAGAPRYATA